MSGHCDFCGVWHSGSCCHPGRAQLQVGEYKSVPVFVSCSEQVMVDKAGLDAMREDARRYRWLRDCCDTTTGFLLGQRMEAGEWDAAIDAAMGRKVLDDGR